LKSREHTRTRERRLAATGSANDTEQPYSFSVVAHGGDAAQQRAGQFLTAEEEFGVLDVE
jgi:hypothetical protein